MIDKPGTIMFEAAEEAGAPLQAKTRGIVTHLIAEEYKGRVWESLDQLAPQDREVIVLRGIEGRSHKDIGDLVGRDPVELGRAVSPRAQAAARDAPRVDLRRPGGGVGPGPPALEAVSLWGLFGAKRPCSAGHPAGRNVYRPTTRPGRCPALQGRNVERKLTASKAGRGPSCARHTMGWRRSGPASRKQKSSPRR